MGANAALCIIMEGALRCEAVELQHELLECFRALAAAAEDSDGLGVASLVQAPLLHRLRAPEASQWPEADAMSVTPLEMLKTAAGAGASGRRDVGAVECLLAAAELARQGDTTGSKHGCVIVEECRSVEGDDGDGGTTHRLLGRGFNHALTGAAADRYGQHADRYGHLHAEAHAVVDAIRRHGERVAFDAFPRATAWIVEMLGTVGYDDARPCPRCESLLRAVGVRAVRHTSGTGNGLRRRALGPPLPHLLAQHRELLSTVGVELSSAVGR